MLQQPVVKEIADRYGLGASEFGWEAKKALQYGFSNFTEEIRFTPEIRRRYRQDLIAAMQRNLEFPHFQLNYKCHFRLA
jgi:hypothetical protein